MSYLTLVMLGGAFLALWAASDSSSAPAECAWRVPVQGLAGDGPPGDAVVEVALVGGVTPIGGE